MPSWLLLVFLWFEQIKATKKSYFNVNPGDTVGQSPQHKVTTTFDASYESKDSFCVLVSMLPEKSHCLLSPAPSLYFHLVIPPRWGPSRSTINTSKNSVLLFPAAGLYLARHYQSNLWRVTHFPSPWGESMPFHRRRRCFKGKRRRKFKIHTTGSAPPWDAPRYSKKQKTANRRRVAVFTSAVAAVIADSPAGEIKPIVRNSSTSRGHIEKFCVCFFFPTSS